MRFVIPSSIAFGVLCLLQGFQAEDTNYKTIADSYANLAKISKQGFKESARIGSHRAMQSASQNWQNGHHGQAIKDVKTAGTRYVKGVCKGIACGIRDPIKVNELEKKAKQPALPPSASLLERQKSHTDRINELKKLHETRQDRAIKMAKIRGTDWTNV